MMLLPPKVILLATSRRRQRVNLKNVDVFAEMKIGVDNRYWVINPTEGRFSIRAWVVKSYSQGSVRMFVRLRGCKTNRSLGLVAHRNVNQICSVCNYVSHEPKTCDQKILSDCGINQWRQLKDRYLVQYQTTSTSARSLRSAPSL